MLTLIIVFVICGLIVPGDAACRCLNTCAGKHCGGKDAMSSECLWANIYQCDGVYNSLAYHYGACSIACVYQGCSLDYCRTSRQLNGNTTETTEEGY